MLRAFGTKQPMAVHWRCRNGYCGQLLFVLYRPLITPLFSMCMRALQRHPLTSTMPLQMWHPEHFACESCRRPFEVEETYYEKDGKPYCGPCNDRLFLTCPACQLPVTEDQVRCTLSLHC
jgi:hypothetical protein